VYCIIVLSNVYISYKTPRNTRLEVKIQVKVCISGKVLSPNEENSYNLDGVSGVRYLVVYLINNYSFCLMVEASDHGYVLHTRRIHVTR
jgi:hypothetical protein